MLRDQLPVDRQGQRLAHPGVGVALVVQRQAEERETRGRVSTYRSPNSSGAVPLASAGIAREDVEVAGQRVGVRGGGVGVDPELDGVDRGVLLARELVEGAHGHALAGHELAVGPEGPVADRLTAESLRVLEERLGQGEEGVVAEADRELGERRGQRDGEGAVVDDPQPAHLRGHRLAGRLARVVHRGLQVAVALDVAEEVGTGLGVGAVGGVVPGGDEGLGGDRRAVVEGPAVAQADGPRHAVFGLDGLRPRRCS